MPQEQAPVTPDDVNSPPRLQDLARDQALPELQEGVLKVLITPREGLVVLPSGEQIHAVQAAGCLLAPAIEDKVLVSVGPERSYLLSVLERLSESPASIGVDGCTDLSIDARSIRLRAGERLTLQSKTIDMTARQLNSLVETVTQTGQKYLLNMTKVIENAVDRITSARTLTTTADMRTTRVKGVDTHKAGSLIQKVEDVSTQQSDVTVMTAKNDVRIDAKRVSVS